MYKQRGPFDKVRIFRFRMLLRLKSLFAFLRNMCTRISKKCMSKKNISSKSLLPLITNQETDVKYHWQIISFRRKSSQTSPLMKSRMTKVQNRTNWCSPNCTFSSNIQEVPSNPALLFPEMNFHPIRNCKCHKKGDIVKMVILDGWGPSCRSGESVVAA